MFPRWVPAPMGLCVEQEYRVLFSSGRKSFSFCATKSCSKETLFVAVFTYTRDTCKDIFPEPTRSATRDGSSGAGFARKGVQKENFVASSEQRKKEPVGVATVGSIRKPVTFPAPAFCRGVCFADVGLRASWVLFRPEIFLRSLHLLNTCQKDMAS